MSPHHNMFLQKRCMGENTTWKTYNIVHLHYSLHMH